MIQQYEQTQIDRYVNSDNKLARLRDSLSLCGRFATKNFYCKKCSSEFKLALLKTTHTAFHCEIRYCDKPDCLVERFVRQLETFNDIKRFNGLRQLWHFSIGFEAVSELDFKQNFSKIKKRNEYVLNRYFEKLRKMGINIQAVRVLDFSFKTEGKVYLHYHFGAIPVGASRVREVLTKMKGLEASSCAKMRIKTHFHIQSFGLASKTAILSYLSIRASGMYKYDMTQNTEYKHVQANLRESIVNKKYIFLKNVLTEEEYLRSFYGRACFVCIGGLPRPLRHGSNITDSIPSICPTHGILERKDIRIEIIFDSIYSVIDAPPDSNIKPIVEVIKC